MAKGSISFKVLPDEKIVHASQGGSVLEALLISKTEWEHSCGGMGTCGTCRMIVVDGLDLLPERNEIEEELAQDRGFKQNERLACQNCPCPGLVIRRP